MDAASDDTVGFRESSGKVRPWTDELFAGSPYEEEISFGQNRRSANGCFGHHWTSHVAFIGENNFDQANFYSICWFRHWPFDSIHFEECEVTFKAFDDFHCFLSVLAACRFIDSDGLISTNSWWSRHSDRTRKLKMLSWPAPIQTGRQCNMWPLSRRISNRCPAPVILQRCCAGYLTRYFSIHLLHPQRLFHRVCDDASRFFSTRVTHAAAVWKIAVNYQWSRK